MSRFMSSKKLIKLFLDTRLTRSSDLALFISITKPFKPVSRNTFLRWIKNAMKDVNVDTGQFTAHTKIAGLNIKTILNSSNWTKDKDNTFKRYYLKENEEHYESDHSNFAIKLLDNITWC